MLERTRHPITSPHLVEHLYDEWASFPVLVGSSRCMRPESKTWREEKPSAPPPPFSVLTIDGSLTKTPVVLNKSNITLKWTRPTAASLQQKPDLTSLLSTNPTCAATGSK
jgi:hypothetical protein